MIVPVRPRLLDAAVPLNREQKSQIRVGDLVEVITTSGHARLWIQVTDIMTRDYFDGIIRTRPPAGCPLPHTFGDMIRFHRRHILEWREDV